MTLSPVCAAAASSARSVRTMLAARDIARSGGISSLRDFDRYNALPRYMASSSACLAASKERSLAGDRLRAIAWARLAALHQSCACNSSDRLASIGAAQRLASLDWLLLLAEMLQRPER